MNLSLQERRSLFFRSKPEMDLVKLAKKVKAIPKQHGPITTESTPYSFYILQLCSSEIENIWFKNTAESNASVKITLFAVVSLFFLPLLTLLPMYTQEQAKEANSKCPLVDSSLPYKERDFRKELLNLLIHYELVTEHEFVSVLKVKELFEKIIDGTIKLENNETDDCVLIL